MSKLSFKQRRALWVKALRSGDYTQGIERLQTDDGDYCCLGVACKVYAKANNIKLAIDREEDLSDGFIEVQKWFGLQSGNGSFPSNNTQDSLTKLNDQGKTFEEIADFIESNPDGLFIK
jgi:hypothetical protein